MPNVIVTLHKEVELKPLNAQRHEKSSLPKTFPARGVALRLFITCWLIYALHFATNTVREIYPALSIGDHFSFNVAEYEGLHPDIFTLPGRGAFINSNPGASILGAIPYALSRPVVDRVVARVQQMRAAAPMGAVNENEYQTIYPLAQEFYRRARARGMDVKFGLAAALMQTFCMAPLSALSVVVMFYLLTNLTQSKRAALWLALLYAFATPVFYRTAQLNQNLLVAHCALFAFVLLRRPSGGMNNLLRRPRYFLAGLLCGWAVVLDYSGVVVLVALALYGLAEWRALPVQAKATEDVWQFGAGVAICLVVLFGYQWVCFGNPFYPAQHYMPAATFTERGYRGMDWPRPDLLWETAFGMRFGLFASAPLLLLALNVPAWLRRSSRFLSTRELCLIVLYTAAFFLFCAANQYGRMQFNTGVRHIVPVVPFLFLLAAHTLLRLPGMAAALVGVIGVYWSWCLAMYRDVEQGWGVFESLRHITLEGFRLPWMTTLEHMNYLAGDASAIPLLMLTAIILLIIWRVGTNPFTDTSV